MAKAFKVMAKTINMGEKKGQTIYSLSPVSYGKLTTDEVAKQISEESAMTSADVKGVLDRYAFYVKTNLRKGYDVELLGFGTLYLRFITKGGTTEKEKAGAKLVKSLVPGFRPSFTILNNNRIYDLIPEKVSLVKYGEEDAAGTDDNGDKKDNSGSGSGTGGNTGSGSSSTDTGSGSGSSSGSYDLE